MTKIRRRISFASRSTSEEYKSRIPLETGLVEAKQLQHYDNDDNDSDDVEDVVVHAPLFARHG